MKYKPVWCLAQCGDGDCLSWWWLSPNCPVTPQTPLSPNTLQPHTQRGNSHSTQLYLLKVLFLNNKKIFLKFILPPVKIGKSLCSYQLSALRYYRKVDTGLTFSICFKNNERASIIHCWEVCQLLDIRSNPIGHIPPGRLVNINHTE